MLIFNTNHLVSLDLTQWPSPLQRMKSKGNLPQQKEMSREDFEALSGSLLSGAHEMEEIILFTREGPFFPEDDNSMMT